MGFDIIIMAFILIMGIIGYKNGFVYTFVRMLGWAFSVVLGFLFYPQVFAFLKNHTGFYGFVHESLMNKMVEMEITPDVWLHGFPPIIMGFVNSATDTLTSSLAYGLTNIVFSVLSFLIIVLGIKILSFVLTTLFSKRKRRGLIGAVDGICGLISGIAMGFLIVFIFLAFVIPFTTMTGNTYIFDLIEGSMLAQEFFNNNLIFVLVDKFQGTA